MKKGVVIKPIVDIVQEIDDSFWRLVRIKLQCK